MGSEEALAAYRQCDSARAFEVPEPQRATYLARCQATSTRPEGDEWDGVWKPPTRSPAAAVLPSAP